MQYKTLIYKTFEYVKRKPKLKKYILNFLSQTPAIKLKLRSFYSRERILLMKSSEIEHPEQNDSNSSIKNSIENMEGNKIVSNQYGLMNLKIIMCGTNFNQRTPLEIYIQLNN